MQQDRSVTGVRLELIVLGIIDLVRLVLLAFRLWWEQSLLGNVLEVKPLAVFIWWMQKHKMGVHRIVAVRLLFCDWSRIWGWFRGLEVKLSFFVRSSLLTFSQEQAAPILTGAVCSLFHRSIVLIFSQEQSAHFFTGAVSLLFHRSSLFPFSQEQSGSHTVGGKAFL